MKQKRLTKQQKQYCVLRALGKEAAEAAALVGYKNPKYGRQMEKKEAVAEYLARVQKLLLERAQAGFGERMWQMLLEGAWEPGMEAGAEESTEGLEEITVFLKETMRGAGEADLKLRMKAAELLEKRLQKEQLLYE